MRLSGCDAADNGAMSLEASKNPALSNIRFSVRPTRPMASGDGYRRLRGVRFASIIAITQSNRE